MEQVGAFKYLGVKIHNEENEDIEINERIINVNDCITFCQDYLQVRAGHCQIN